MTAARAAAVAVAVFAGAGADADVASMHAASNFLAVHVF